MSDFWQWAMNAPWLTFFLFWIVVAAVTRIVIAPFRLASRLARHKTIRVAGWPPAHLDADGDWKPEESE